MPVEIREIVIKTTVNGEGATGGAAAPAGGGSSDALKECVDGVLQVLHDKNER